AELPDLEAARKASAAALAAAAAKRRGRAMSRVAPAATHRKGEVMKKRVIRLVAGSMLAGVLLLPGAARAQFGDTGVPQMRGDGPPAAATPFRIEKLNPALEALIAPNARPVELARGYGINEGVTREPEGGDGL